MTHHSDTQKETLVAPPEKSPIQEGKYPVPEDVYLYDTAAVSFSLEKKPFKSCIWSFPSNKIDIRKIQIELPTEVASRQSIWDGLYF